MNRPTEDYGRDRVLVEPEKEDEEEEYEVVGAKEGNVGSGTRGHVGEVGGEPNGTNFEHELHGALHRSRSPHSPPATGLPSCRTVWAVSKWQILVLSGSSVKMMFELLTIPTQTRRRCPSRGGRKARRRRGCQRGSCWWLWWRGGGLRGRCHWLCGRVLTLFLSKDRLGNGSTRILNDKGK